MFIKPPITKLLIRVSQSGFYRGFSKDVTITAKVLVAALILWAIAFLKMRLLFSVVSIV